MVVTNLVINQHQLSRLCSVNLKNSKSCLCIVGCNQIESLKCMKKYMLSSEIFKYLSEPGRKVCIFYARVSGLQLVRCPKTIDEWFSHFVDIANGRFRGCGWAVFTNKYNTQHHISRSFAPIGIHSFLIRTSKINLKPAVHKYSSIVYLKCS